MDMGGACRVAVRRCGHSEHGGVSGSVAPRRDPTVWQCGIAVIAAEVAAGWVGRGQYGATLLVPIFFDFKCVSEKSGDLISVIERNVVILFSNIRFFDN